MRAERETLPYFYTSVTMIRLDALRSASPTDAAAQLAGGGCAEEWVRGSGLVVAEERDIHQQQEPHVYILLR